MKIHLKKNPQDNFEKISFITKNNYDYYLLLLLLAFLLKTILYYVKQLSAIKSLSLTYIFFL